MSNRIKKIAVFGILIVISLAILKCTKENFVEPVDPFEIKRLEPDPRSFNLGEGANALTLKVNHESVLTNGETKRIKGSVYIENSLYGDIRIANGDFELTDATGDTSTGLYFTGFRGNALLTLPQEGLLKNLELPGITAAPIGFKKGSEFETGNFAWPVNKDHYYFFYENLNPFPVNITNSSLENIKKIAIDPTDPFFFVTCDFNGTPIGDISDVGVAISAQGLIPFTPLVTVSEMELPSFNGNIYITGAVPLGEYPATFQGESVLGFNSEGTEESDKFFSGDNADFKLGLNGQVTFDHTALDWMGIDVVLGQASMVYFMDGNGHTKLSFVGIRHDPPITVSDFINEIIAHDWDFLDYLAPYEQKETFYGSIGTQFSDWAMGFKLETWLNLPGGYNIDLGHTYLYVDPNLMNFSGEAVLAGFSRIGVEGEVHSNTDFRFYGYVKSGFKTSWHALSLRYDMSMEATLSMISKVVSFGGKVKMSGRACVTIAKIKFCAGFHISASVSISSNGNYKVCFSIGIGKLGFDVCLSYKTELEGQKEYRPEMTYVEIPLEQVPIQNRFPIDE